MSPEQIAALSALANGINPADALDGGAAAVNAGPRIADRIAAGINTALYLHGLETAAAIAREKYDCAVDQLDAEGIGEVLAAVQHQLPAFLKQLRADVSALYLSDPAVWQRIGFPGPSTKSGGYPDFDREQDTVATRLKE